MANACRARQLAPFHWCRLLVPFGQIPRVSDPGRLFVPVLGGLAGIGKLFLKNGTKFVGKKK